MLIDEINAIKKELYSGMIDYNEAKLKSGPIIEEMNKKAAEIAKKYGRKAIPVSFSKLMR
jgi:hypothetical protein